MEFFFMIVDLLYNHKKDPIDIDDKVAKNEFFNLN